MWITAFLSFSLLFIFIAPAGAVVDVSLSMSQMSLFLIKMDNFLASKCELNKYAFMGHEKEKEWKTETKKLINELKVVELRSYFGQPNVSEIPMKIGQKPSTMCADTFMDLLLKKMLEKLPKSPNLSQEENVLKVNELSKLTQKQNLLMLLELFYISSTFGHVFFANTRVGGDETKLRNLGNKSNLINLQYYEELEWKFKKAEEIIKEILNKEYIKGKTSWFDIHQHFSVQNAWNEPEEDILAWKLEIKLEILKLAQIIKIIGQFINKNCGKNLWNLLEESDQLTKCSILLDFAELDQNFAKELANRFDNSLNLVNLIGQTLNSEAAFSNSKASTKWHCAFNVKSLTQILDEEGKLSVLKGLLQFGRLFVENFGIFVTEMRKPTDKARKMEWKNILIRVTLNEHKLDEMKMLHKLVIDAGLIERM